MCTFLGEDNFFFRTIFEELKYISSLCCFYRNIHESQANRRTYSNLKTIFKITFSRPSGFFFLNSCFLRFFQRQKSRKLKIFPIKISILMRKSFFCRYANRRGATTSLRDFQLKNVYFQNLSSYRC